MAILTDDYKENIKLIETELRYGKSFDILKKTLTAAEREVSFYFIDGFIKDGELQRIMQNLLSQKTLGAAEDVQKCIPYVEIAVTSETKKITTAVLSGQTAMFAESFSGEAIILDLRTYPSRETAEPESDRVMQGARDGFVETLIMNTALLRRRIRDPRLTFRHFDIGGSSHTDVAVCYMEGIAKKE